MPSPAVERVLDALERRGCRPRRSGSGWSACCPAHEDRNPSLSLSEGDDGRALLHCHAGCETDAIARELELEPRDLFSESMNGRGGALGEPEAIYDYVDEAGELLFQVCRFAAKQFRQRQPDGSGGWVWNLRGVRRVPYRLPRVLEAVASGEPVLVCEGEKDVEAAERAGVPCATTCPMGAGKWRDEYAQELAGATVVIVADRDEPGLRHARDVARSLERHEARVQLVGPLEGKDLADHLAAGLTLEELEPWPLEWIEGQLAADAAAGATEGEQPRELVGLTFAQARLAQIPPTRELVEGLIDVGTVGLVAGLPFARKSWAALEIGHKVAAGGGEVFGRFPVVAGGPVVYVWQDDSLAKELERLQLYAGANEYPDELPLRFLLNEDLSLPDDIDALAALVERESAVLVFVDSLYNALAPTVKLKEEEVAVVLAQLKAGLCDRTGASVGLVDHAPWPSESNRGQRRAYGSVFKTAAVRWSIHLEADAKDDTRLHIEASGNNVAGVRRTPACWDAERLEIRLLEVERIDEEALDELVLGYVSEHPGQATKRVAEGVGKRRETVIAALERLGTLERVVSKASRELGRAGTGRYWFPVNHACFEASLFDGNTQEQSAAHRFADGEASQSSQPRRGDASPDRSLESTQEEHDPAAPDAHRAHEVGDG